VSTRDLTVILTTHNRADVIGAMLASLAEQSWDGDWDVIVLDNDSTDATTDVVEEWLPRLQAPARIVRATERHHVSYARNSAVAATDAVNVAFIDDDDLLGLGWVAAIGTALRDHEFVASRADYERLNDPALAATCSFQRDRLGLHYGVPTTGSAGSAMRRALYLAVGGNAEVNSEDTDFSLRMHRHGVRLHFCTDAVYHVRLRSGFRPAYRRGLARGRGEVQLYTRHRDSFALQPESAVTAAGRWLRLVAQAPALRTPAGRTVWAEHAGRRVGRTRTCVRERTWYP